MSKVKREIINEIHRSARVNFPRRHVILKDIDDLWQADLMDMQSFSKFNNNCKYILVVIDGFSKYAWTIPLKQKDKQTVSEAFNTLLSREKRIPRNLQTDLGKEFYNKSLKKILLNNSINHYCTYSTKKASIVERLIRTIKSKLFKEFSFKGNYKWIDGTLANIINRYNHTIHRTIGLPPIQVNHSNKMKLLKRYFNQHRTKTICRKFKTGDFVRISKHKGCFEKGYTPNWSTEIFKISKVQNTNPVTYLFQDVKEQPILGAFYDQELQKTKHPDIYLVEKVLKRKGRKVFVKWLGLSSNENSWIGDTNVL